MLCFPSDRWLKSKHAHAIAIITVSLAVVGGIALAA